MHSHWTRMFDEHFEHIRAQLLFASVIHIWHHFRDPFLLYLQKFCCCMQKCSHSQTNNCNWRFQKFSASYQVRRVSKINSSKCWVYLAIWKNVHVYSFNKIMLLDVVIYGRIYGAAKKIRASKRYLCEMDHTSSNYKRGPVKWHGCQYIRIPE